jgi:hypothetical protein
MYAALYAQLKPQLMLLSKGSDNAQYVAQLLQQAWDQQHRQRLEEAKLRVINEHLGVDGSSSGGSGSGGQQRGSAGQGDIKSWLGGSLTAKQANEVVRGLPNKTRDSLLRALVHHSDVASLQTLLPVTSPTVVAAAGAHAGLRQQQAIQAAAGRANQQQRQQGPQQGQPGADDDYLDCACIERRHPPDARCYIANPKYAFGMGWKGVSPRNPNFVPFVLNCKRQGITITGEPAGGISPFPAALCVEVGSGTYVLQGGPILGACMAAVAAAATRASAAQGAVQASTRADVQLVLDVQILLGRDKDLVDELLKREQGGDSTGLAEAAAAGMFSFRSDLAEAGRVQQAEQWAQGTVTARVALLYPRDEDLLKELLARNALVKCVVRGQSGTGVGEEVCMRQVVASVLGVDGEQTGGIAFFAQDSAAEGLCLILPGSAQRTVKPVSVMLDNGCQPGLMDKAFGESMGLKPRTTNPTSLCMASGGVHTVSMAFEEVEVVLAKGTANEFSTKVSFLCIPGLAPLAQVIYPALVDHRAGGAGVDTVLRTYGYRPRMRSHGDMTIARLPIVYRQSAEAPLVAAMMMYAEQQQAASGGDEQQQDPGVAGEQQGISGTFRSLF